jgi:hypothetical protein
MKPLVAASTPPALAKAQEQPAKTEPDAIGPFGKDGFTFFDFLDVINPLQHLPIVSTLYRDLTGDTIDPGAKMAGGTLFGGPIGLVSWIANSLTEAVSGKDIGENVLAVFGGDAAQSDQPGGPVQVAEAAHPDPSVAAFETAAGSGSEQATPIIAAERVPLATEQAARTAQDATGDKERFAIAHRESGRRAAAFARTPGGAIPPSGSLAPEGGWFSNAMLSGLQNYRQAADLPKAGAAPHTVNALY